MTLPVPLHMKYGETNTPVSEENYKIQRTRLTQKHVKSNTHI